jgi:serine/threonine-protein kinase
MSNETILNNRYRLTAQQGSGGMAVIYKAIDIELGRTVAIKILRPSLTNDPTFLVRFRNEARAVANLSHPNIVTVYDVGNEGPTHYMVMEYVEGQDLKKIIKTLGAVPVQRALNIAIQICAGIGFAHRAGLVHADIKPQNILMTKDDVVKVTDFGIAQALSDTQPGVISSAEREGVVWGSPHYFAPEQARGEKPTPASDVYAIGIVLFEMLTGRLPYTGSSQQELALAHIRERVPMVTEFNPAIPDSLAQIVYKVMGKEPSARYRMADQFGQVLAAYRDRGQEQTASNVPPAPSQRAPASPMTTIPAPPLSPSTPPPTQPNQPMQPPAASPYKPVRPLQQSVMPPAGSDTTQKYSVAPNAPEPNPYARPQVGTPVPTPLPPQPQGYPSQTPIPQQPPRPDSGRYYSQSPYEREDEAPAGLDVVTIVLAVLAFFAVACLIPLYIAVFQARFGG